MRASAFFGAKTSNFSVSARAGGGRGSGVARVPCALGHKIFLRPSSTKRHGLKWKIGTKVQKKQKQNIY